MANLKFHGATLDERAIAEFYPDNDDFNYFLFQPTKDLSGDYYLKVYAIDMDGNLIKEVTVAKDSPSLPLNFDIFIPASVTIGKTDQLDKLDIPSDENIESIKLKPKKYKKNYVGFKVKIKSNKTLSEWDEEIDPSPPADPRDNDW